MPPAPCAKHLRKEQEPVLQKKTPPEAACRLKCPVFKDFRWGQAGILANLCTSRLKDRGHSPILISHISPRQRTDRGKTTGFSEKKFGISGVERGDRFFKLSPFRNPHFLAQKWRYFTVNKPAPPTTLGIFCPNRGLWYRSEWPI